MVHSSTRPINAVQLIATQVCTIFREHIEVLWNIMPPSCIARLMLMIKWIYRLGFVFENFEKTYQNLGSCIFTSLQEIRFFIAILCRLEIKSPQKIFNCNDFYIVAIQRFYGLFPVNFDTEKDYFSCSALECPKFRYI